MKLLKQLYGFALIGLLALIVCLFFTWPLGVWGWLCEFGADIADLWRIAGKESGVDSTVKRGE